VHAVFEQLRGLASHLPSFDAGNIVGIAILLICLVVGIVGTLLPFLPGTPLIFIGALIYALINGFGQITVSVLIALGIIAVISTLLQYLASTFGAKKLGSTNWGVVGAFIGVILGIFIPTPFGLFNLVIFPFVFAFLFELIATSSVKKSLRAGFGGVIGVFGGILMQFVMALVMAVIILIALL
jgi:uncharacterized protein YqgC (DUF456 family)